MKAVILSIALFLGSTLGVAAQHGVSLDLDDLPPGYVMTQWDTNGPSHQAAFQSDTTIIRNAYILTDDEEAAVRGLSVLSRAADIGAREAPREIPGPQIGDESRWWRATSDGRPALDVFTVVFRVGRDIALVQYTGLANEVHASDVEPYARLLADRLAEFAP